MTQYMTVPETAHYLRCSERHLRELLSTDQIPHVLFAGKALFSADRLDAWLLSMERGPKDGQAGAPSPGPTEEDRAVRQDCPRDRVAEIISEFLDYDEGFVSRLGRNLKQDLDASDYAQLSGKTYAQLSRWCHPKRHSSREKWAQPRAQEMSRLLFGEVIGRVKHPSYD